MQASDRGGEKKLTQEEIAAVNRVRGILIRVTPQDLKDVVREDSPDFLRTQQQFIEQFTNMPVNYDSKKEELTIKLTSETFTDIALKMLATKNENLKVTKTAEGLKISGKANAILDTLNKAPPSKVPSSTKATFGSLGAPKADEHKEKAKDHKKAKAQRVPKKELSEAEKAVIKQYYNSLQHLYNRIYYEGNMNFGSGPNPFFQYVSDREGKLATIGKTSIATFVNEIHDIFKRNNVTQYVREAKDLDPKFYASESEKFAACFNEISDLFKNYSKSKEEMSPRARLTLEHFTDVFYGLLSPTALKKHENTLLVLNLLYEKMAAQIEKVGKESSPQFEAVVKQFKELLKEPGSLVEMFFPSKDATDRLQATYLKISNTIDGYALAASTGTPKLADDVKALIKEMNDVIHPQASVRPRGKR